MTDELLRELERVAYSEPTSGREAQAKVVALRTIERLRRSGTRTADYPVDDDGRFHPSDLKWWWDLDRCDSDETREHWRERLSG